MLFAQACLIGMMVAVPVGPVALLIIQRSLKVGSLRGVASGLGAAVADGLFGFLAAVGLVALVSEYEQSRFFLRPLGGLALMIVGIYFCRQKPPPLETTEVLSPSFLYHYLWDALSTFFLTLMNPATIIAFAAIFAGSDLIPEDSKKIDYLEIASGVFTGSLLWWLLLVSVAQPLKKKLSPMIQHRILQSVGMLLISLGLLSLISRAGTIIDKIRPLSRFFL